MNIIKKAALGLAGLILLALAGWGGLKIVGSQYDRSSQEFVSLLAKQVFADWNTEALRRYSGDEVYRTTSPVQIKQYFAGVKKRLGGFRKTDEPQGESSILLVPRAVPDRIVASYFFYSEYEKATARIQVTLAYRDKTWKILGLRVISDALLK